MFFAGFGVSVAANLHVRTRQALALVRSDRRAGAKTDTTNQREGQQGIQLGHYVRLLLTRKPQLHSPAALASRAFIAQVGRHTAPKPLQLSVLAAPGSLGDSLVLVPVKRIEAPEIGLKTGYARPLSAAGLPRRTAAGQALTGSLRQPLMAASSRGAASEPASACQRGPWRHLRPDFRPPARRTAPGGASPYNQPGLCREPAPARAENARLLVSQGAQTG
jgi:hypothetical protein